MHHFPLPYYALYEEKFDFYCFFLSFFRSNINGDEGPSTMIFKGIKGLI